MTEQTPEQTPDNPTENMSPGIAVQRRLALAWLALSWERIWSRLWIVGVYLILFGIVLIIDILPTLHWVAHAGAVVIAAAAIGYTAWRRLRGFAFPTREEARARLETTSNVTHRPLTTVEDTLAAGASAIQQWMWRLHQERARQELDSLRVKGPNPDIAARDRFALRSAVVLALFVAVVGAWGDIGNRIWRGVLPMFDGGSSRVAVKLWITPPAYTNRSPIYLESPAPQGAQPIEVLDIPAGSKALAVVTGARRAASFRLDEESKPLDKLADETQRGEIDLKPMTRFEVRQGSRAIIGYDVNWIADKPPVISSPSAPTEAPRWRLRIDYKASDDYAVESITAQVTKADKSNGEVPPLEFPVQIPAGAGKTFVHASIHDLASHPWAGQRVYIQLTALDQAGQKGASRTMEATLPERVFVHPVSKELAKLRKEVAAKPEQAAQPALESVTKILQNPQSFNGEPLVHLTLSTAKYRLAYEPAADAAHTVPDLLWHAAVRIEDGNLVSAEQRLVDAEKALREAIERGASPEEISRLLDELKQAVADYAKAVAEKNPDQQNGFTQADAQQADQVAAKAEELRQASEMGAMEQAKQALDELQKQLQTLRDGQQGQGDKNNKDVKQSQQMMAEMRDLTKQQSDLLNESFEQAKKQAQRDKEQQDRLAAEHAKGMQMPQRGNKDNKQSAAEAEEEKQAKANTQAARGAADKQEALRKKLGEVMQKMEQMTGQKSEGMGEADNAMSDARDNLNAGAWKEGADGQSKALSKMQQSMAQAQEQLMQSLFEKGLGGVMEMPGAGEMRFSPLGARDGRRSGEHVDVPTGPDQQGMAQRVRAILEEIRTRASDRTRPEAEQDYLRRLMKQF